MATKSLPLGVIELVATNLHLDRKDFYVGDLRDKMVAAMPDAGKRNQYAAIIRERDIAMGAVPEAVKPQIGKTYEETLKSFVNTWFKGTVFDSCYAPLKEAQGKGTLEATLTEMRRNAVGSPPDTFATDVRALLPNMDDNARLAAIRNYSELPALPPNLEKILAAVAADAKFRERHGL